MDCLDEEYKDAFEEAKVVDCLWLFSSALCKSFIGWKGKKGICQGGQVQVSWKCPGKVRENKFSAKLV